MATNFKLDILFLQETEVQHLDEKSCPQLENFNIVLPNSGPDFSKVRIVALVKKTPTTKITVRRDLMSHKLPSIWIESRDAGQKKMLVGSLYREWSSSEGVGSISWQETQWAFFMAQLETASNECDAVVVMGDMNLDQNRFKDHKYSHKNMIKTLRGTLDGLGMKQANIGNTFISGQVVGKESALDHIYHSEKLEHVLQVKNTKHFGSSDHALILIRFPQKIRKKPTITEITKRSFKNFECQNFKAALAEKNWQTLDKAETVDEMFGIYDEYVEQSLNTYTPIRTFKITNTYRSHLSERTYALMEQRDQAYKDYKKEKDLEGLLFKKYKTLRNKVTASLRKDARCEVKNKVKSANNDCKVLWQIAKEKMGQKNKSSGQHIEEQGEALEDSEACEAFGSFFISKVEGLKHQVGKYAGDDPLNKLRGYVSKNPPRVFHFREVTEQTL